MQIIAADIGTGTQDIFLYDTQLNVENGFKLVLPSPTITVYRQIKAATQRKQDILLTGVTMGGGPSHWATESHLRAGLKVYATSNAARSFNDDLDEIRTMGINIVSEDEVLKMSKSVLNLELKDFDFPVIAKTFESFGVSLKNLALLSLAVFDHGAAPPNYSDRKFRFEYLDSRIKTENRLSAFAYRSENIPESMTRMRSIASSAQGVDAPIMVMDTAPAAVLGATLDRVTQKRERTLITNIGNFHTIAFRLGPTGIEGVFEHHTGFINTQKMETLLKDFAEGTLTNEFVFKDMGHGALVANPFPYSFPTDDYGVIVTGPRRNILNGSILNPYFAVPFGDMMLAGCFGMLAAAADIFPNWSDEIQAGLYRTGTEGVPPWEIDQ